MSFFRSESREARTEKWTTIPLRLCAFARVKNPPRRMRLSALPATEGFARRKKNEARKGLRQSNRAHHYSFAPACGRQVFARIKKISRKVRKTQRPPEVKPSGLQFLCVSATLREEINESPSRNSAGQVYPLVKSLSRPPRWTGRGGYLVPGTLYNNLYEVPSTMYHDL